MTFGWNQNFSKLKSDIWPCQCISGYRHMVASASCFWFQPSLITPSHLTEISWSFIGIPIVSQQATHCQIPSTIFRVCLLNTEANRNTVASFCLPLKSWLPSHYKTFASQRENILNLQAKLSDSTYAFAENASNLFFKRYFKMFKLYLT